MADTDKEVNRSIVYESDCPTAILVDIDEEQAIPLQTPLKSALFSVISPVKMYSSIRKERNGLFQGKEFKDGLLDDETFDFDISSMSETQENHNDISETDKKFRSSLGNKESYQCIGQRALDLNGNLSLSTDEMDEVFKEAAKIACHIENISETIQSTSLCSSSIMLNEETDFLALNLCNGRHFNFHDEQKTCEEETSVIAIDLLDQHKHEISNEEMPYLNGLSILSVDGGNCSCDEEFFTNAICDIPQPEVNPLTIIDETKRETLGENKKGKLNERANSQSDISLPRCSKFNSSSSQNGLYNVDLDSMNMEGESLNKLPESKSLTQNLHMKNDLSASDVTISGVKNSKFRHKTYGLQLAGSKLMDSKNMKGESLDKLPASKSLTRNLHLKSDLSASDVSIISGAKNNTFRLKTYGLQLAGPKLMASSLNEPNFTTKKCSSESNSSFSSVCSTNSSLSDVFVKGTAEELKSKSQQKVRPLPQYSRPGDFSKKSSSSTSCAAISSNTCALKPKKPMLKNHESIMKPTLLKRTQSIQEKGYVNASRMKLPNSRVRPTAPVGLISDASKVLKNPLTKKTIACKIIEKPCLKEVKAAAFATPTKKDLLHHPEDQVKTPLSEKTNRRLSIYATPVRHKLPNRTKNSNQMDSAKSQENTGSLKSGIPSRIPPPLTWRNKKPTTALQNKENKLFH